MLRDGKETSGRGDKEESGEAGRSRATVSNLRCFGGKDSKDDVDDDDVESRVETVSFHSATSDDRHDINHLAKQKVNSYRNR